jgi:preprotein translocase subunit SecY
MNTINDKFSKNKPVNILLTESARKKLFLTFLLIFLIRIGASIPIPGIDESSFSNLFQSSSSVQNVLKNFSGSNSLPTLFSLGISPSINASIIMQLFLSVNPDLKKMQREEGEFGRRKIAQYIRYLTLFLSIVQSLFLSFSFKQFIFGWTIFKAIEISFFLTTGSMVVLWISEVITKSGITNGSSLLVFLNIIGNTPEQFKQLLPYLNIFNSLLIIFILFVTITSIIFLQQSIIYIPIVTLKISIQNSETANLRQKTFLPFKFNQIGVMPIVFTSYMLPVLTSLGYFCLQKINNFHIFPFSIILPKTFGQIIYFGVEFFLICLFTYFYSTLILNPKDVSDDLQKTAFFIPGIRPGQQTFQYLEKLFQRQALIGGFILAANAVLLNAVGLIIKLPVLQGISIGSQIIIVGVIIDIVEKFRALMISDIYKNYLKKN